MAPRRLRVLLVLDWFFYYAAALAGALSETADVMIVTRDHGYELGMGGDASELKREILDPRVRLVLVRGQQSSLKGALSARSVAAMIREFAPDIVHSQDNRDWRLLLLARCIQAPQVLTVHDVVPHVGSRARLNPIQQLVQLRLRSGCDAVVVHGEGLAALAREMLDLSPGTLVVSIPHGALRQPAEQTPLPQRPCVLFFGRLEHYKGLDVLVRGAEIAAQYLPELRVVIAGAGPEAESARSLVTRPEIFDWRIGFVPDDRLAELFASATVVVLPYREASQSGVVPLAFANGRSVIASDVGALSEAVDDGVTGILVPSDDVNALADALVRFHESRERAEAMTARALDVVTSGRLSSKSVADAHLDLYYSLLGGESS